MRRFLLALCAAAAFVAAGSFMPGPANAMALSTPAGIAAAAEGADLAESVAYVCRRVRVCGPYGCSWRRHCYHTRPYRSHRSYRYRYHRW